MWASSSSGETRAKIDKEAKQNYYMDKINVKSRKRKINNSSVRENKRT